MPSIEIDYLVMTTREPPNHDAGYWSEHHTLDCALTLMKNLEGRGKLYERVDRSDAPDVVLTPLDPSTGKKLNAD